MNTYLIVCTCGKSYNCVEREGNSIQIDCKCGKRMIIKEYTEECRI